MTPRPAPRGRRRRPPGGPVTSAVGPGGRRALRRPGRRLRAGRRRRRPGRRGGRPRPGAGGGPDPDSDRGGRRRPGQGGPGGAVTLTVVPLPGIPEVRPGDDLARLLLEAVRRAGLELADGDVLAVTSKVVAKAEGRLVPLPEDAADRERVHRETVAAETARVVARRGRLVIAETHQGLVGANALGDASNAGGG